MKRTLMQIALGTCVIAALTSCSSTDEDGFMAYEEATPMSEYEVAADTIPPWLINDPEVRQIAAGSRTPTVDRNTISIPEPENTVASTGGTFSMGQNQGYREEPIAKVEDIVAYEPSAVDTPAGVVAPKPKPTPPPPTKKPKKISKPTMVIYTVRAGDNLSLIASRSGTTVAAIRKLSGIKGNLIHPGQKIKVPYTPQSYKFTSKKGSTTKSKTHTVRRGETVDSIARKNGLNFRQVLSANNMSLSDAKRLRVGQTIKIPVK
ncbi:MAG: LysM peptidoglycan-binding domain-containing protein [Akkermansia sp.]